MIVLADGVLVGDFKMIPASEGGCKHEDGGFWGVEVSNKAVYDSEFESWINEDVVFSLAATSSAVIFKSAGNGGAKSNNATMLGFGRFDSGEGIFGDLEPFGVHFVLFNIVGANRQKSAEPDMKSEIVNLNAFFD